MGRFYAEGHTEYLIMEENDPYYEKYMGYCKASKELYNAINETIWAALRDEGKWIRTATIIDRIEGNKGSFPQLPSKHARNRVIWIVNKKWENYFRNIQKRIQNGLNSKEEKDVDFQKGIFPSDLDEDEEYPLMLTMFDCQSWWDKNVGTNPVILTKEYDSLTFQLKEAKKSIKYIKNVKFYPRKENKDIRVQIEYEYW